MEIRRIKKLRKKCLHLLAAGVLVVGYLFQFTLYYKYGYEHLVLYVSSFNDFHNFVIFSVCNIKLSGNTMKQMKRKKLYVFTRSQCCRRLPFAVQFAVLNIQCYMF